MMQTVSFDRGSWMNPPKSWSVSGTSLSVTTDAQTDFWQKTHYGFEHSNGHALLFDMPEHYAAEVTFTGDFTSKYEQAGLLLWESETRWIKAGIENADGRANLAVVVTDGRSDWSMAPANGAVCDWTIRMSVTDSAVLVHALGLGNWQILRVANFVASGAKLGPMACSPLGEGLKVEFCDFRLGNLPKDPLYISA